MIKLTIFIQASFIMIINSSEKVVVAVYFPYF